jgi:hypothetical protein
MSMGPSFLTVHERSNGDIGLVLPNQTTDMYVLRASAKPGPKGSRSTQDIVRCKDDTVLASIAWIDPKKDMIKIEKAAYMSEGECCGSWIRLVDAWKSASPTKGNWSVFLLFFCSSLTLCYTAPNSLPVRIAGHMNGSWSYEICAR